MISAIRLNIYSTNFKPSFYCRVSFLESDLSGYGEKEKFFLIKIARILIETFTII